MTVKISFNQDDDVTILRDGELLHPPAAEYFAQDVTPQTGDSFEKFGHLWKRNASAYEHAINDLAGGGLRFILRTGDMPDGNDAKNMRERAEVSGSDFAMPLVGTYDFDFTITIRSYDDSPSWSSMVQLITDDSDSQLAYQPLLKMQTRPSENRITLDAYWPEFVELGSLPLLSLNTEHRVRITVNFDTGYARWAVNGETMYAGMIAGLDTASGYDARVYPKIGAYRAGAASGTVVNDFSAVSFTARE